VHTDGNLGSAFVDRSAPGVRLVLGPRTWGKPFDFTITSEW